MYLKKNGIFELNLLFAAKTPKGTAQNLADKGVAGKILAAKELANGLPLYCLKLIMIYLYYIIVLGVDMERRACMSFGEKRLRGGKI